MQGAPWDLVGSTALPLKATTPGPHLWSDFVQELGKSLSSFHLRFNGAPARLPLAGAIPSGVRRPSPLTCHCARRTWCGGTAGPRRASGDHQQTWGPSQPHTTAGWPPGPASEALAGDLQKPLSCRRNQRPPCVKRSRPGWALSPAAPAPGEACSLGSGQAPTGLCFQPL